MRIVWFVVLLAAASAIGMMGMMRKPSGQTMEHEVVASYRRWKLKYGRLASTPAEADYRLKVFRNSYFDVKSGNEVYNEYLKSEGKPLLASPMFSLNQDADLSQEEYTAHITGLQLQEEAQELVSENSILGSNPAPKKLAADDFEIRVRDQGACHSCWAFSAISVAERVYHSLKRVQIDLSQQELVDCDQKSNGCMGGWPDWAFDYIGKSDVSPASAYPYQGDEEPCKNNSTPRVGLKGKMSGGRMAFSKESGKAIAAQGVWYSTGVNGSGRFRFLSATDDVYEIRGGGPTECSSSINHAVTVVEHTDEYVKILSSGGKGWANKGMKKVKPCSETAFWGVPNVIMFVKPNL